jgi:hypothetical protein
MNLIQIELKKKHLERPWSLDIEKGLHFLFGDLKCKLWPKERLEAKYVVWLLTITIKKKGQMI